MRHAEVVFNFTSFPGQADYAQVGWQRSFEPVEDGNSDKIRLGFADSIEVSPNVTRQVADWMHEWCSEVLFCRMVEQFRESPENAQVGGTLQVEHPPALFGLVIMLEANFL